MEAPSTRYARGRDGALAYQVAGEGPPVTFVMGATSASRAWDEPWSLRFLDQLASFARLVTFDQRGTGSSDPIPHGVVATLEERADDALAVLDAARIERTALLGTHDGGAVCILLAAQHPERVSSLILFNTWARLSHADDHPWGADPKRLDEGRQMWAEQWGTGASLDILAPSAAADPAIRRGWARHEQASASPSQAEAASRAAMELDVRHLLPAVHLPTLVLHTAGNLVTHAEHGRDLAARIPGAVYVELPGRDHVLMVGDSTMLLHEVQRFVTGSHRMPSYDRVLATLLFTDIVDSTVMLQRLGDVEWRRQVRRHDELIRAAIVRYRGREVDTAGDSFLATFDGPARAVACAEAIVDGVHDLGISVRAGLHTGECEIDGKTIRGIAVHIAARVSSLAGADDIFVTRTVKDLVAGSGLHFTSLGPKRLKGIEDEWEVFAVLRDPALV